MICLLGCTCCFRVLLRKFLTLGCVWFWCFRFDLFCFAWFVFCLIVVYVRFGEIRLRFEFCGL